MRRLREKLHSESGASILLALLLFLVCCMVAVSILAAVMSNAGKVRSNQAEQQKYLTLSSAIQLVADEIEQAEYKWGYTVYEWDEITDSDDIVYYFYCEQKETVCKDADGDGILDDDLHKQIPLEEWLNWELKKQFPVKADGSGNPQDGYKPLEKRDDELFITGIDSHSVTNTTRNLLVTLEDRLDNGTVVLDGYSYEGTGAVEVYQVPKEVTVRVELDHTTHHIRLTAWLGTDSDPPTDASNTMIAELVAAGDVPALSYINPERRIAGSAAPAAGSGAVSATTAKTMKWELNWIKKGGL